MTAPQTVPRMHTSISWSILSPPYSFLVSGQFCLNQFSKYKVNHQFPIPPLNIVTSVAVHRCYLSVLPTLDDDNDSNMCMHVGKKPHEFHHSHSTWLRIGNISKLRPHISVLGLCHIKAGSCISVSPRFVYIIRR